ncbi:type VI secretion system baseplate subunit TssF [Photobacterium sp. TY1-4]|uniref:type VI secretion system baseplate subunit TssF n=1 Tax=Photobacterium sp. TY1-4 TaxID=2899122 RepID=UPI0021C0D018|nr:type VI secretion system baseplate subunit TssF [Photobacterium sp. TY1-4]UXI02691.1 type VI secretion system baseplate subunit TssF [Photobacterium sp. TY1-4]
MSDEILKYFNRELAYIRHMGGEFSKRYPKVATRLRLSEEHMEDPHVSRLIESFALLTAQTRRSLDDAFPQLTEALIGQLFPDFYAPIPSMAMIKMSTQNITDSCLELPKGSEVITSVEGFKPCKFTTAYDTELWPVEVVEATFENAPFKAPNPRFIKTTKSVLKLKLKTEFDNVHLSELDISKLRFYLNGPSQVSLALYQLIFKSNLGLAFAAEDGGEITALLQPRHIQPVGFDEKHQVVPYQNQSFNGYRLLVENFIFPEKFLFFEVAELEKSFFSDTDEIYLYLYFDDVNDFLPKQVTEENILLGCTPMINLFEQELEPFSLTPSTNEHLLVPRYDEAEINEVVYIKNVDAFDKNDNRVSINPFYGKGVSNYLCENEMYWHIRREISDWAGGHSEPGCECYLNVVNHFDKEFSTDEHEEWIVAVTAQCSNRNLPIRLPYGGGQPKMSVVKKIDSIGKVDCIFAPTPPVRPDFEESSRWQFSKHLTLNHFSGDDGLLTLKEVLRLYDFEKTPQSKALIESITDLSVSPCNARVVQNGKVGFCHGSEILIEFSTNDLSGINLFFFGTVLSSFFSQFTAINSFSRLSVKLRGSNQDYHRWPAQAGGKALL